MQKNSYIIFGYSMDFDPYIFLIIVILMALNFLLDMDLTAKMEDW